MTQLPATATTDTTLSLAQLQATTALTGFARIQAYRDAIAAADRIQKQHFDDDCDIEHIVRARATFVDAVLRNVWNQIAGQTTTTLELIAVGGYGRGELHPASDIDVMVLLPDTTDEQWQSSIENFVTFLWDIGLEAGHSVRTIDDCVRESVADITVATSLMESRCIVGSRELFVRMREAVAPDRVWNSREFFEAKLGEQTARHNRYDDTGYKLEPNVKGSPGGLRDIQMIGWVAKRHFGVETTRELVELGFLTDHEFKRLRSGRQFLWKVRFALHSLTGRREDRLLFDHQTRIAEMLGYRKADHNLAVEQMMQRYYRTVMELSLLNEMLLQLFREAILMNPDAPAAPLHPWFQVRNGYLEAVDDKVFQTHSSALLEIFRLLQQNTELQGVSANTIRLLKSALDLIDDTFRANPVNQRHFMDILQAPRFVNHALRRMNAYGVLGRYLPAFEQIVGRMQYDLFHTYTVDAHTLFVVRNLRRFARHRNDPTYPMCGEVMEKLAKPEIAYIAGLFHDIAKGRGGDHSELGARDAEEFCLTHGLGHYEARLAAWLVRNHLILSVTAQKKDIDDPQIIHDFATTVGDEQHLNYLYVLTVADITGTNPSLWNSWKASLFQNLYLLTRRALRRGLENPIDKETLIRERQQEASALLASSRVDSATLRKVWSRFTDGYFLRHSAEEIAWHTRVIAAGGDDSERSLVAVEPTGDLGGTSVFVYTPPGVQTFARTTAVLDELGLNILDARISVTHAGHSLDTFRVTENTGEALKDEERIAEIAPRVLQALEQAGTASPGVTRRAPRQVRMFSTATEIAFHVDTHNRRTILELTAGDRPGLLSRIGEVFIAQGVEIQTAKITTVGERAEDVFYVCDRQGQPLDKSHCAELHTQLIAALDDDG